MKKAVAFVVETLAVLMMKFQREILVGIIEWRLHCDKPRSITIIIYILKILSYN